jgi:hypothetical protein
MPERSPCEFSLIRYVPDPVKNEFVNIGVLLREAGRPEAAKTELRFTRDWKRVRCVDPHADLHMLEALERELQGRVASPELLRMLGDSLSNVVQMTEPKACLADTFQTQLDQLMQLYVETHKIEREGKRSGRAAIFAETRRAFERQGVWKLMRHQIAAEPYLGAGDPLKIDFGYRPNGIIKMFHAVSLEGDLNAAKSLAFSMRLLADGVAKIDQASLQMTAIIEAIDDVSEDGDDRKQYKRGIDLMESNEIRVWPLSQVARLAEVARTELKLE